MKILNHIRANWIIVGLILFFIILRLPGIHVPYHQDEWKNVTMSSTSDTGSFWSHPPLFQMSFRLAHLTFGADYYRLFPLCISLLSILLLYTVVRRRIGKTEALWSVFLYIICFYSVLGSLQPDVDGTIIPCLFLLSICAYDYFIKAGDPISKKKRFFLLAGSIILGLLIKLNFILVAGALFLDYFIDNWRSVTVKKAVLFSAACMIFGLIYVALLYLIQQLYAPFTISAMLGHANQFSPTAGRNFTQIFVQGIKAVYYLSPLLLLPLFFTTREIFNKTRIFWIYLSLGFVFYFIAFDFSRGALDKYLMFFIVPLAVISGVVISGNLSKQAGNFREVWHSIKVPVLIGVGVSTLLVLINFLPHAVVALYPKTEWFLRALHGQWLMLTPLTGGSGPMGFYVSFAFIVVTYIASILLAMFGLFKKDYRRPVFVVLLLVGISYNLVFVEEYVLGKINGNAASVLYQSLDFIKQNDSIKSIMSYNDIGNQYLTPIGKYAGRIYAVPEYEDNYKAKFASYTGQYMVIDIPHLYEDGLYGKFFAGCKTLYETSSARIKGFVYDCSNATSTSGK